MKRTLVPIVLAIAILVALGVVLSRKRTGAPTDGGAQATPFFALHLVHDEGPAPGFHSVDNQGTPVYVSDAPLITEADYSGAEAKKSPEGVVTIVLHASPQGQRRFAAVTTEHRGQTMALLIDGHVETLLTFDQTVDTPTSEIARPDTTLEEAQRFAAHFGGHAR